MKLSSVCIAAVAAIGLATPAGVSAFGQTGQISQSFDANQQIFTGPLSTDLRQGAAETLKDVVKRAQGSGQCPIDVDLLVIAFSATDERRLIEAVAQARRDQILSVLNGLGPSVTVKTQEAIGLGNMVSITAKTANRDNEPPSLSVTWTPPKGSIVKAGERITVDATARDDANRFQTGVAEIEFLVLPQQDQPFGFQQWFQRPMRCEDVPPAHHTSQDYVVPSNPPPVVRLAVHAKDFAGHDVYQLAEFPTVDWVGTLVWSSVVNIEPTQTSSGTRAKRSGRAELGLTQKRDGTVEGTLRGSQISENWWGYVGDTQFCRWRTAAPADVQAKLEGAYEQARG